MKIEKLYIMLFAFLLLTVSFVSSDASYYEENYSRLIETDSTYIVITKLRYESYPVSPGDYFTLYVQVQKSGSNNVDVDVELLEEYPFSLDSNEEAIRSFSNLNNEPVVLEYKVRVDDNAVSGENILKIRQSGSGATTIIQKFDITVEDVQTSFDAVVQESTSGEISIALANVGLNDANAAIVRIPEQEGISVSGTSGQMIGNLEQGDYTIVGFSVLGKSSVIKIQVDYTDTIGVRRSEIVEVPFNLFGNSDPSANVSGEFASQRDRSNIQDSSSSWTTYLVWTFVIAVLVFIGYKYVKKKKNIKGVSSHIPEWMKKEKGAKK